MFTAFYSNVPLFSRSSQLNDMMWKMCPFHNGQFSFTKNTRMERRKHIFFPLGRSFVRWSVDVLVFGARVYAFIVTDVNLTPISKRQTYVHQPRHLPEQRHEIALNSESASSYCFFSLFVRSFDYFFISLCLCLRCLLHISIYRTEHSLIWQHKEFLLMQNLTKR